jgi:hypothetical protein
LARIAALVAQLGAQHIVVAALAARCRDKIADPPRLAVPDASVLGDGPSLPDGAGDPGAWTSVATEAAAFEHRLGQVAAALAEANERYGAPLSQRSDLRGLLDAYRDRAAKAGLTETASGPATPDPVGPVELAALYAKAHETLWTAPCDLDAATVQVTAYQQAVLAGLGHGRHVEDPT